MNTQRFAVIIVAIVGMIATFLPWYTISGIENLTGVNSSGWFTFIMFALTIFIVLRKDTRKDMSMGTVWGASAFSVLATFIVLWRVLDIALANEGDLMLDGNMAQLTGQNIKIAYGAWIVMLAGLAVPLAALLFRNKKFTRS